MNIARICTFVRVTCCLPCETHIHTLRQVSLRACTQKNVGVISKKEVFRKHKQTFKRIASGRAPHVACAS